MAAENLEDRSGNGHHLTLTGTGTFVAGDTGFNDAYDSPGGTGDYLANTTTLAGALDWSQPWTVELKIKLDLLGTTQYIAMAGDPGNATNGWLIYVSAGNAVVVGARDSAGTLREASTGVVTSGVWYSIAMVWDGTDLHGFRDGTKTTNTAIASVQNPLTNVFAIGLRHTAFTFPFNGQVDELRVSDTARYTSAYTPETAPFTDDANTVALYSFGYPPVPAPVRTPRSFKRQQTIRVVTHSMNGSSADITNRISGLSWSSVQPGGDETCSFTYHSSWRTVTSEVDYGTIIRVMDGLNVLWAGRIDAVSRTADAAEKLDISCFGMGVRFRDNTFTEAFRDRDQSQWKDAPVAAKQVNADWSSQFSMTGDQDWYLQYPNQVIPAWQRAELWYQAPPGSLVKKVNYSFTNGVNSNFIVQLYSAAFPGALPTLIQTFVTGSINNIATLTTPQPYVLIRVTGPNFTTDLTAAGGYIYVGDLEVSTSGGTSHVTDDLDYYIANIVARVPNVTFRKRTPVPRGSSSTAPDHLVFRDPTSHEEAIKETGKLWDVVWGTWPGDSVLDLDLDQAYFEWEPRVSAPKWSVHRDEVVSLDLQNEIGTLYNRVDVFYQDANGIANVVTRTAASVDLDSANITRTARVDGGTLTTAGAQTLGDIFLAQNSGFARSRGNLTVAGTIRHEDYGLMPVQRMRADGSSIKVGGILSSRSLVRLDTTPDMRSSFPIKRVEISADGDRIEARIELDQTSDTLTLLQQRLANAANKVLGFS